MSITRRKLPLSSLRAFEAAARLGSFKRAAEELGVTPAAISHQVHGLEQTLGTALFTRQVRKVVLTEAGLRLFPVLRSGFDAFQDAIAAASNPRRREVVTIGATNAFTARWLVPRLAAFREAEPAIDLQLAASDEVEPLAQSEVDIAIRYGSGDYPGHVVEPLWQDDFAAVCNPLLGVQGVDAMAGTPLIDFKWKRAAPRNPTWAGWSRMSGVPIPGGARYLRFSDETHAIQATVAGQGIGLLSTLLVAPELASGALVECFGPRMPAHGYHLVMRPRAADDPTVAVVASWIKAQFGGRPH